MGLHGDHHYSSHERTEDHFASLSSIYVLLLLNPRATAVHSVHVGGHPAEFVHNDPLFNLTHGISEPDCHRHPELKRKLYSALQESDEGELAIAIPKEVSLKPTGSVDQAVNDYSTPEPHAQPSQQVTEFSPVVVKVSYSLRNPTEGIQFVLPTETQPHRVPHVYTTPSSPDAARCWIPCIDNYWEKCTWEFEFVVPRYLEESELVREDEPTDAMPTIVVCSGELVEQVAHPYNSHKTIFLFSQAVLTSVQHIAFASGPFHLHSIPADNTADDPASSSSQPLIYTFCLPGQESFLSSSTFSLRPAMSFYSSEFGSYPFGSFKIVFVDDLPAQRFDSSTLALVSMDMLHGDDAIEPAIETRQTLSHALACQWVGINIQPKQWSDLWLVNGLAGYINGLFLRKLLGNNEYRFRLKKDMERVIEWDNGGMPPICQPQHFDPPDSSVLPFINLKAPLVLHILDRRLGKSGMSLGLSRVLPKVFLSAISGEMQNNFLSTHAFLRMCRKVSSVDPRSFAEQWIYGSGCPSFGVQATFNRKKMAVEITMRQECPAFKVHESSEVSKILMKPVPFFEGQMTIRIHEADGTPYEHVLDIRSPFKRYEVPFNTKYKRVRRNTKRYLARQAAAQAAAEGDLEAAEAIGMIDMGFGLDIWENEQERENWKVADWTEEDEGMMSGATYEWIRMDADFEWIATLRFEQPDFMWVSQLQRDRDVVAQLELNDVVVQAVHALAKQPTAIVSSTLTKTVLVSNYHYRIRCEAALALVQCSIRRLDFLGLFHLFKLFLRYCYDPEDSNQDLFTHGYIPKPNDFSDLAEYLVRKYSDAYYICTIIGAAACANVSTAAPERGELLPAEVRVEHTAEDQELLKQTLTEVDRYRSMDRLIPSVHNIVTIAALEVGVFNNNLAVTLMITQGNYTPVRIAAFDGLFLTKWYTPQIMRYVLAVMANDPSRVVRRHVARSATQSLAILVQMGELKSNAKDSESLLIEEDGSHPEKHKESKKTEMDAMIKVLRKDREVGKNEEFRNFAVPIALAPDVDHEVRWCMLKLLDILIRPVDEAPPTVRIHIPSTPVSETAPPLPAAKIPIKPLKSVPKTPSSAKNAISIIPPKLKLPAHLGVLTDNPRLVLQSRPGTPKAIAIPVPPFVENGNTKISNLGSAKRKGRPPKSTKAGHTPKAQSAGMSVTDYRASRAALKKLTANKHAKWFLQAVDPVRDHAPDYFTIIKNPMDLGTMSTKLEQGLYKDRFEFQSDFRLMIANAKQYNMPGSFVHNEAISLEIFFEKQWVIISKTLNQHAMNNAAEAEAVAAAKPLPKPRILPPVPEAKFSPPPSTPARSLSSAPARPTIKLKLSSHGNPSQSKAPVPKPRKIKTKSNESTSGSPEDQSSAGVEPDVDAPPPPYIDDGSHDLLQEVIAIEREKDEKRQRLKSQERAVNGSSSKRKHTESSAEDDILALATPAKREKQALVAPSSSFGLVPANGRIVVKPPKAKKDPPTPHTAGPSRSNSTRSTPTADIPRSSAKGKEKEVPVPPTPAAPIPPSKAKNQTKSPIPINEKKCKDILKALLKIPDSAIFHVPVDPVRDGCPTYLDEIKHPMDLGTMSTKLGRGEYGFMEDFRKDMDLIFINCRRFNPTGTFPVLCADVVETAFKKEWGKMSEKKLSWTEKRSLQGIMNAFVKEEISFVFREPVDPILLGIPTYFDVIPRKDARDLRTIRQKLDSDKYETVGAFQADIDLMIRNAITFNGAGSKVGKLAMNVQEHLESAIANWKQGNSKKRKDGEKSASQQPSKKHKSVSANIIHLPYPVGLDIRNVTVTSPDAQPHAVAETGLPLRPKALPYAYAFPPEATFSSPLSGSRSSIKVNDDVTSLTSFNPFSEEDENDQSSYTLVTSIFSRMKNSFAAPLASTTSTFNVNNNYAPTPMDQKRPLAQSLPTGPSRPSNGDRPNSLSAAVAIPAPPLVSLTPAQSEAPTYSVEYERSPYRTGMLSSESADGGLFGTSIPGFPIPDDARSVKTTGSLHRSGSVSKVIRRAFLEITGWTTRMLKSAMIAKVSSLRGEGSTIVEYAAKYSAPDVLLTLSKVLASDKRVQSLATVDDDDDDDRRSIVSSVTSFPAHQFGLDSFSLGFHPQSPFAASQLFGRDEPFNLYSIAETKRPFSGSDDSGFLSRPHTPYDQGLGWEPADDNPAPFRRAFSDEDKDVTSLADPFDDDSPGFKTPIDYPNLDNNGDSTSTIQFPVGSPEGPESPFSTGRMKTRFDSYAELQSATPFIRSRVQSRLDNAVTGEPGWRTRRESTAYAQELNLTSMLHLKIMLKQMLTSEQIPNVKEWEETLLKLALRVARDLTFTALPHRQGEDMDVRRYVKIKKIPGAAPHDSEYVDGAVITKNVIHKNMSRSQRNPRVMLVTFPLEFSRVEGQYMHFGQIVRQEKEYLNNLVTRIAALRPHVILVEKSVSRIALESLLKHNIAVARTVRPSAIQLIARMTQTDLFSSMDKLALEPRLGHCSQFRVQTFDHPLIPGRRKTLMRFEGCSRDMGCTIILRGGDISTLRKVKKVTRLIIFLVRNLKLETHLWKDSVITLPAFNADATPAIFGRTNVTALSNTALAIFPSSLSTPHLATPIVERDSGLAVSSAASDVSEDDLPDEDAETLKLSRRIEQSLEPYLKTFISVSATLRFLPPYPILRMKELDLELRDAQRAWEDEIIRREERSHSNKLPHTRDVTITLTRPEPTSPEMEETGHNDISAQIEALPTVASPSKLDEGSSYFSDSAFTNVGSSTPHAPNSASTITSPDVEGVQELIKTANDIAAESNYGLVKWKHEEFRRIWEWYLRKNSDDFIVEKYQCLSLLQYTIPITEVGLQQACFAPRLQYITFYGENDCTLGQYIERSVTDTLVQFLDPKAVCTGKACDQPLARHCQVYVHNQTRLFVAVEQWDGQIIGRSLYQPSPDLITTWSACRVCGSATPFIPVSEEMQRYSFAKFLELHFYPSDVKLVQGAGCQHNIYQHHIRYFASKGMTLRFQADPVVLHEVVYPPFRIRVRPETQLDLKNSDFQKLHHRNVQWYSGLIDDLKLISIEAATGDEESDAALIADINQLIRRAEAERHDIATLINDIYKDTPPTDTLALNQVRSYQQDKIVAWQQDFDRLPKPKPPPTTDRNSKRMSTFGSVRAMWPRRYELSGAFDIPHLPSSSVSEAEEGPLNSRRANGDSLTSSASEASEPEPDAEPSPVPETSAGGVDKSEPELKQNTVVIFNDREAKLAKSDGDSDSTIAAVRDTTSPEAPWSPPEQYGHSRVSRLPRRSANHPSVADLVRKYQDFLPPQGVHDLSKTALAPRMLVSESDQEYTSSPQYRAAARMKSKHRIPRNGSISDFEQGYAANIAPRYLTRSRRSVGQTVQVSRIPGPAGFNESQESSRRPSPEKHAGKGKEVKFGRQSPPNRLSTPSIKGKARVPSRSKDKVPARPPSASGGKSPFRRPSGTTGGKVSNIAKHFERLGRDSERSRSRYNVIRAGRRARPVASARARVEVLESLQDAIKDEDDSSSSDSFSEADDEGGDDHDDRRRTEDSVKENETPAPVEDELQDATVNTVPPDADPTALDSPAVVPTGTADTFSSTAQPPTAISLPPSPFLKTDQSVPQSDLEAPLPGAERNSIFKAISGFWLQPSPMTRSFIDSDDLLVDPEHIFRDSSMVVRTDEPTSIIALALNSPQYREMLAKSRAEKRTAREFRVTESGGEVFMPDDHSIAESTSTWGVVNMDNAESADPTEDLRVPSSKLPWAITFESGGLTISCTVLYPEQFDALRRTYGCEKSMIESLARCIKWNASGGKSGELIMFLSDDRFIAKELSRPELQTMETFAPAYFDYMSSSVSANVSVKFSDNRPTLLAKVFGCYKLTFKKTGSSDKVQGRSKSTQMNLLVMENLFYDRRFSKIYDLKGSTRNRHVQSTGRENEVLLDENLVQKHSKRILRGALYNDSKFLADISVMDYSLVCGVRETWAGYAESSLTC
ncbi:hypothetical protein D9757_002262 [Collybiopsis confluens]|uniref:Transcription initiation factor TFIID subunit 2 n=1 Tax=Collybiopsis confluens TaxID=2823264 RepID=A0A8H5HZN9_9AGAR|nr:hypothetical protein D9757_002262 [Collybiopsis confluens]